MKHLNLITLLLLSSLAMASPFVSPSKPHGKLNLGLSHPSQDIFPVSIIEIDGQQVIKRDNAVWLKPGTYTIRVSAIVSKKNRSTAIAKKQNYNGSKTKNSLEVTVEEGKTYFVGYDASNRDSNMWGPVVWKVK